MVNQRYTELEINQTRLAARGDKFTMLIERFLYFLGRFIVIVCVFSVVIAGGVFYKAQSLNLGGKRFVDAAVPAILGPDGKNKLLGMIAPECRTKSNAENIPSLMAYISTLGPLIKYEGALGQGRLSYVVGSSSVATGYFTAKAQLRDGLLTLDISLLKHNDNWTICDININRESKEGVVLKI